jgi:hypothetical protein
MGKLEGKVALVTGSGRVEFSLLADAVEDRGPTLVEFSQIPQPPLERAQLGVIERPSRLLPISGNKGHGCSAVEQRDGGGDLLLADASSSAIRRLIGFIDPERLAWRGQ